MKPLAANLLGLAISVAGIAWAVASVEWWPGLLGMGLGITHATTFAIGRSVRT